MPCRALYKEKKNFSIFFFFKGHGTARHGTAQQALYVTYYLNITYYVRLHYTNYFILYHIILFNIINMYIYGGGVFGLKYKKSKKFNISRTTAVTVLFLAPMDRELNSKLFSQ